MPDDTPVIEMGKIIDIGYLRIARGYTRRPVMTCAHHRLVIDDKERRLWCQDCEKEVDAFDFLRAFMRNYQLARIRFLKESEELNEARKFSARLIATRVMEKAWRKRSSVPVCPHCHHGIHPEDVASGVGQMDKDLSAKINANRRGGGGSR